MHHRTVGTPQHPGADVVAGQHQQHVDAGGDPAQPEVPDDDQDDGDGREHVQIAAGPPGDRRDGYGVSCVICKVEESWLVAGPTLRHMRTPQRA